MRFLDYQKVRQAERTKATELFGTAEEPTELATKVRRASTSHPPKAHGTDFAVFTQIMGVKSSTFNVTTANGTATSGSRMKRLKLTEKEKSRLQDRIKKATSLQEIIELEKALEEGRLPPGILGDDDVVEE